MDITSIIEKISNILGYILPVIISLAVIYFLWGLVGYVSAGGDEEKRKKGRDTMINGIIVLFVMIAVWGLVAVIKNTFGISVGGGPEAIPELPKPRINR